MVPELIQAGENLPVGTLIDGETVIADNDGCVDFTALQVRLSSARKQVLRTAFERAAVLAAFDALQINGLPLADEPLAVRREQLERLLEARHPCLQLVEQTSDVNLAEDWLMFLPSIEGVVAKRADRRDAPGRGRDWVKVKRYRTIDCIVIGVAGDLAEPKLVLALMHPDNLAHHLGRLRGCHLEGRGLAVFSRARRVDPLRRTVQNGAASPSSDATGSGTRSTQRLLLPRDRPAVRCTESGLRAGVTTISRLELCPIPNETPAAWRPEVSRFAHV